MVRIHELKIQALEKTDILPAKIEKRLHLSSGELKSFSIAKERIDARQKPNVYKVYSVDIETDRSDSDILKLCKKAGLKAEPAPAKKGLLIPKVKEPRTRPVIAGFGPCGIFAALTLAMAGARPIVLERGPSMEERVAAVKLFWETGKLDISANCQFGEGGAGTFSDGKLTTGTRSEYARFVLEEFVKAGANEEILYKQKPHIGTDVLRTVVVNLRKEIESLGGEVHFGTKFTDITVKDGKLTEVITEDGSTIEADTLVMALGHSARDTVRKLYEKGLDMEKKPFSMGLRIEHPQSVIDRSQYGTDAEKLGLGPADYKLSTRTKEGRGVYTFCMCPGGVVVNASSFEGCITCNGMSYFKRDSGKANSAVLADVRREDIPGDSPLDSIAFQEKYERRAFALTDGSYKLPTETLGSFMTEGKLKECLPDFVYDSLTEAIPEFGKKLKGFDEPKSLLYAIESRSSSPVRIKRTEDGLAMTGGSFIKGLYPAGEGAGYAGGIMSAACDGVKTAMKLLSIADHR